MKYLMTIPDACEYFGIEENEMCKFLAKNENRNFVIFVGYDTKVKRKMLEEYIDVNVIF